jgi:adenylate kinase family enzyme
MASLSDKIVICLIGGPGVGKGTQSDLIKETYDVGYMSAGDLLRKAAKEDSDFGRNLAEQLRLGQIVAPEITLGLLKAEIESQGKQFYVIDGFPRSIGQATSFCEAVVQPRAVISIDAPDDILSQRILGRAQSSGRSDDNEESIKLRLTAYHEVSYPVIEFFGSKVHSIDGNRSPQEVFADVRKVIDGILAETK